MAGQTQSLAEWRVSIYTMVGFFVFFEWELPKAKVQNMEIQRLYQILYSRIRFITRPSSGLYAVYCAYSPQCQVTSEPFSLTRTDRAAL